MLRSGKSQRERRAKKINSENRDCGFESLSWERGRPVLDQSDPISRDRGYLEIWKSWRVFVLGKV